MDKAKPFCISKREVWEAYKRVKANGGAAGVDEQSIAEFEEALMTAKKLPVPLEKRLRGRVGMMKRPRARNPRFESPRKRESP